MKKLVEDLEKAKLDLTKYAEVAFKLNLIGKNITSSMKKKSKMLVMLTERKQEKLELDKLNDEIDNMMKVVEESGITTMSFY